MSISTSSASRTTTTPTMPLTPTDLAPPAVPLSSLSTASLPTSPLSTSSAPSSPKRPRRTGRALALEALIEDIADNNASASRTSPLLTSPLPALSTLLAAHLPDAALVTAAYYIATLDVRVPVNHDNASALLVACLGAGAPAATDAIAAAAGVGIGEVRAYAEIARVFVPRAPGPEDWTVYDQLLRGVVEGLVD